MQRASSGLSSQAVSRRLPRSSALPPEKTVPVPPARRQERSAVVRRALTLFGLVWLRGMSAVRSRDPGDRCDPCAALSLRTSSSSISVVRGAKSDPASRTTPIAASRRIRHPRTAISEAADPPSRTSPSCASPRRTHGTLGNCEPSAPALRTVILPLVRKRLRLLVKKQTRRQKEEAH